MNIREMIRNRFLEPFSEKKIGRIGVELEFPLLCHDEERFSVQTAHGILLHFMKEYGFTPFIFDTKDEKPLFIKNECGDAVSFDNSFHNFEFSLMYSDNLLELRARYEDYRKKADEYFSLHGYSLAGRGTHPHYPHLSDAPVHYQWYDMVRAYLERFPGKHGMSDFPAFLSSVQTHLDVGRSELPEVYTLFSRLSFVHGLLFSNSPDFEGKGYRSYRDFLWEKSGFGDCPNITGVVDTEFHNEEELIVHFLKKGLFLRERNGVGEVFLPVPISEYFTDESYGAKPEDLEGYLSFQNIEITCRGTLEVREDCAQKRHFEFVPPAFHLGILTNWKQVKECLDTFFAEPGGYPPRLPSELRKLVVEGAPLSAIQPEAKVKELLDDLWRIAKDGLRTREKGEEILLPDSFLNTVDK